MVLFLFIIRRVRKAGVLASAGKVNVDQFAAFNSLKTLNKWPLDTHMAS